MREWPEKVHCAQLPNGPEGAQSSRGLATCLFPLGLHHLFPLAQQGLSKQQGHPEATIMGMVKVVR